MSIKRICLRELYRQWWISQDSEVIHRGHRYVLVAQHKFLCRLFGRAKARAVRERKNVRRALLRANRLYKRERTKYGLEQTLRRRGAL